ncbi:translation initiation factor IF-2-like [Equus quagga]|uniref:translation initiation factor IF-2-like n=1 Tax=Equus quagga TaxID=89248 RepID=UPI001EE1ECAA|nr:translation initiation factor IF-2-like [Equus quagga]
MARRAPGGPRRGGGGARARGPAGRGRGRFPSGRSSPQTACPTVSPRSPEEAAAPVPAGAPGTRPWPAETSGAGVRSGRGGRGCRCAVRARRPRVQVRGPGAEAAGAGARCGRGGRGCRCEVWAQRPQVQVCGVDAAGADAGARCGRGGLRCKCRCPVRAWRPRAQVQVRGAGGVAVPLSCWCIRSVAGSVGTAGLGDETGCALTCSSVGGSSPFQSVV